MDWKTISAVILVGLIGSASADPLIPFLDPARVSFSQTGEMDLGTDNGELTIFRLDARSILSRPIHAGSWVFIPQLEYRLTSFDFDGLSAAVPFQDEDLHSLSLNTYFFSMRDDSPWIIGGWTRAELASDFQHIDGDDFTFDIAGGIGYRFSEKFMLGLGATVVNLNGNAEYFPGINFDWIVSETVRVGIYGPTFVASCTPSEDWSFSVRGVPAGGIWNLTDDAGESRSIDFASYRVGLFANRRLTGHLWLEAGGGLVFGNRLDYTTSSGTELFGSEPDESWFGMISLRLEPW